jgi:hypothetical protein
LSSFSFLGSRHRSLSKVEHRLSPVWNERHFHLHANQSDLDQGGDRCFHESNYGTSGQGWSPLPGNWNISSGMAHLVLDDEAQDFHQALNLHHSQEARTMPQRLGVSVAISVV